MTNKQVIKQAFQKFQNQIDDEVQRETVLLAQNLVYRAIQEREKNPRKHDFTGNLLNSIVSAVYKDKNFVKAFFSGETGLKSPRYYEMTASHGRYHFKIDYEGRESNFNPEIETLRRKGLDDAYEFVSTYSPDTNGFVVVVAYTTDYADFVEQQNATTGFLSTFKYADRIATKMFPLKK